MTRGLLQFRNPDHRLGRPHRVAGLGALLDQVGLDADVDGMVHLSDLDWNKPGEQAIEDYKKGDKVTAKVLDVDVEKERIAIGIKQMATDPFAANKAGEEGEGELRKGSVVTCEVVEVKDGGLEVKIVPSIGRATQAVA